MAPKPLSCLLLEDDAAAAQMIADIVRDFFPAIKLIIGKDISEARRLYTTSQPELLILDINLPDGLSLDWLHELFVSGQEVPIIFTTAHANYAVEAFKFSALDFLLKPFIPQELVKAINKALKIIVDRDLHLQLETFFYNYQHKKRFDKKIILKTLDEISVVNIQAIIAIQADNSYSKFFLKEGRSILVSQPLKEFDQQLNMVEFMRVHQSYLANMHHVIAFKKKNNCLLLEEGIIVPVSLNKRSTVIEYLNNLK